MVATMMKGVAVGLFDSISNSLPGVALSAGAQIAKANVLSHLPPGAGGVLNTGLNVAGDILSGNLAGAVGDVFSSGLLTNKFPRLSGAATQARFLSTPSRVFGGITPLAAKQMHAKIAGTSYALKNLFFIEVQELNSNSGVPAATSDCFNFFATEVEYSSVTLTGEKRHAGGATVDGVQGREAVELSITTLDDVNGTLKTWFQLKSRKAVAIDGTVGVPYDYLVRIKIRHATQSMEAARAMGASSIFGSTYLMRPVSLAHPLSRREQAAQEVHMTFTQFDTFHPFT